MDSLRKDRMILKRLVESYGKKDVLNYVKHLNESSNNYRLTSNDIPFDTLDAISFNDIIPTITNYLSFYTDRDNFQNDLATIKNYIAKYKNSQVLYGQSCVAAPDCEAGIGYIDFDIEYNYDVSDEYIENQGPCADFCGISVQEFEYEDGSCVIIVLANNCGDDSAEYIYLIR